MQGAYPQMAKALVIQACCLGMDGCVNNGPQPGGYKASSGKAMKAGQSQRVRQNVCAFMSVYVGARACTCMCVHVAQDLAQSLHMTDKYSTVIFNKFQHKIASQKLANLLL